MFNLDKKDNYLTPVANFDRDFKGEFSIVIPANASKLITQCRKL